MDAGDEGADGAMPSRISGLEPPLRKKTDTQFCSRTADLYRCVWSGSL